METMDKSVKQAVMDDLNKYEWNCVKMTKNLVVDGETPSGAPLYRVGDKWTVEIEIAGS